MTQISYSVFNIFFTKNFSGRHPGGLKGILSLTVWPGAEADDALRNFLLYLRQEAYSLVFRRYGKPKGFPESFLIPAVVPDREFYHLKA